jgi:hypothetical protein
MTHELKTLPQYFERVLDGSKTFETRKNDRGFQKDDTVAPKGAKRSGATVKV